MNNFGFPLRENAAGTRFGGGKNFDTLAWMCYPKISDTLRHGGHLKR